MIAHFLHSTRMSKCASHVRYPLSIDIFLFFREWKRGRIRQEPEGNKEFSGQWAPILEEVILSPINANKYLLRGEGQYPLQTKFTLSFVPFDTSLILNGPKATGSAVSPAKFAHLHLYFIYAGVKYAVILSI